MENDSNTNNTNITTTTTTAKPCNYCAILSIIPIWILFGNSFVLLAVISMRRLRTLPNFVIASLAITDFILAIVVVPFAVYQLTTGVWRLGLAVCLLWSASDVFLSTASILHLVAIAIHRHLAITRPLLMRHHQTKQHVILLLLPVWLLALAISIPLIIRSLNHKNFVLMSRKCGLYDRAFAAYSSIASFFLPLVIMIVVDLKSVYALRTAASRSLAKVIVSTPTTTTTTTMTTTITTNNASASKGGGGGGTIRLHQPTSKKRAETTLIWVFICFVALWLPFFTANLIYGLSTTNNNSLISERLFLAFSFLGYASSGVNPFIYTLLNSDFRLFLKRIFSYKKTTTTHGKSARCNYIDDDVGKSRKTNNITSITLQEKRQVN